mgnify:CR=1 FL=1
MIESIIFGILLILVVVTYITKLSKKEDKESHFKVKYEEVYSKLGDIDSLTQKEFQAISGTLEAYGEVYLQAKTPKEYDKWKHLSNAS